MHLHQIKPIIKDTDTISIQDGRRVVLYTGLFSDIKDNLLLLHKIEKIEAKDNRIWITIFDNLH